ncbi:MAG: ABC transporter six-transmembrane domain-containing protein [Pseudomonadota bacterium]
MLSDQPFTIGAILRVFRGSVALTWSLVLVETALMALVPLFIGFAIDELLLRQTGALWTLAWIMAALIGIAVARRVYDTRVYGTIRVELGVEQAARSAQTPVSVLTARLGMGRELVDFLEHTAPEAMAAAVQLAIAVAVLYAFSPAFAAGGGLCAVALLLIYALFHRRFFRLNGALNRQMERQVGILEHRRPRAVRLHLARLRVREVGLSDAEAVLYGAVFAVLSALVLFNLWFATTALRLSTGEIFSTVSYSWQFVDSALALPATLQSWSRLAEISRRLNRRATD